MLYIYCSYFDVRGIRRVRRIRRGVGLSFNRFSIVGSGYCVPPSIKEPAVTRIIIIISPGSWKDNALPRIFYDDLLLYFLTYTHKNENPHLISFFEGGLWSSLKSPTHSHPHQRLGGYLIPKYTWWSSWSCSLLMRLTKDQTLNGSMLTPQLWIACGPQ